MSCVNAFRLFANVITALVLDKSPLLAASLRLPIASPNLPILSANSPRSTLPSNHPSSGIASCSSISKSPISFAFVMASSFTAFSPLTVSEAVLILSTYFLTSSPNPSKVFLVSISNKSVASPTDF